MDKFQTNVAGNIDSGTEVLANNLVYMQNGTEKLFSDLFGRTFTTGIINTEDENTMFPLSANTDGTFNIGQGIGYIFDIINEIYQKISITQLAAYNSANPTQTTDDGTGNAILTPKSSGCSNIPIPNANIEYEIWLEYLQICENGNTGEGTGLINYSIAKQIGSSTIKEKRFYQWADGYKVTLKPIADTSTIQGLCLGTVTKASNNILTFTDTNRTQNLLIKPEVFMEYLVGGTGLTITTDPTTNKTTLSVNIADITSTMFSLNGGPSSSYLASSGNVIYLTAPTAQPLIVHPANMERYTVDNSTEIEEINIQTAIQEIYGSGTIDRICTLCINNTDKTNNNAKLDKPKFEIMEYIYVSKTAPATDTNRIWLDTSTMPYVTKWYNNTTAIWENYYGVPIAYIRITNTALNGYVIFDYNKDYTQWDKLCKIEPYAYDVPNLTMDKYLYTNGSSVNTLNYYDLYMKTNNYPSPYEIPPTTFTLPDTVGKVLWGGATVTYLEAGLPNIKGDFAYVGAATTQANNAFSALTVDSEWTDSHDRNGTNRGISFNANNGSVTQNIYKDDCNTVQPPALQLPMFIRALL